MFIVQFKLCCIDCLVVSATDPILKVRSNLTGFPSVVSALGHNSSRLCFTAGVDDEEGGRRGRGRRGRWRGRWRRRWRVSCPMMGRAGGGLAGPVTSAGPTV